MCNIGPPSHKSSCRAERAESMTKITKVMEVSPYKKWLRMQELLGLEEIKIKEWIKS